MLPPARTRQPPAGASPRPAMALAALVLAASACQPLRQPLGTLGTGLGGAAGAGSGTAGTGATPGRISGTQIPWLPPEWTACDSSSNAFRCFQDPALPSSPPPAGSFSGAPDPEPTQKPVIVYPLPGSIHPINLADITFQWRRAPDAAQTLFRLRLARANGDAFEFFVPCNHTSALRPAVDSECVYHLPPGAWLDLAQRTRGDAVTVEVAGYAPTRPGVVAKSDAMTISFSPEFVGGGFYYWTGASVPATPDSPGTMRLLFGARASRPFITPLSSSNPEKCSGCHAVSRDGSTIAFTAGLNATGSLHVAATSTPNVPLFPPATTHDSGTLALNHDGSRVLVSVAGRLFLRDARTGDPIMEVPPELLGKPVHGFQPEWSPDDKSIALMLSSMGTSDWSASTGAIGILPYADGAFGPVETLVPAGTELNFYPTWSPDGHWLAFATAPVGFGDSYVQPNARLRLVNRDTKAVYELGNATAQPGRTTTWPRFAPFAQAGGLMFLTFNSKNEYGFFRPLSASGLPQLWITAIDVRKLRSPADDPSSAPVWLPFQDVVPANYLGAWAERLDCRVEAGKSLGCGDREVCDNGACAMLGP
jgi:hypothetical protein